MTRLTGNSRVRRETCAVVQRKPLVIELRAHTVYMRLKGARWSYEVDYQSIWVLGANKFGPKGGTDESNGHGEPLRRPGEPRR